MQGGFDFDEEAYCGGVCLLGRAATVLEYMDKDEPQEPPLRPKLELTSDDGLAGYYGKWPAHSSLRARLLLCTMARDEDASWLQWLQLFPTSRL